MLGTMQMVRRWQQYLSLSHAPRTLTAYRRTFLNMLGDLGLEALEVTEDDLVGYIAECEDKAGKKQMVVRAAMSFYKWADDRGLYANPARRIHISKPGVPEAPFLEEEQMVRLFLAAWGHKPRDPRRAPTVALLLATGARIESAEAVEPSDLRDGRIYFRRAKGDRPYSVPLGELGEWAVAELLRHSEWASPWAKTRRPTLIGVGHGRIWQWVNDAARESGVSAWPHLLRHTYGTVLAEVTDPATWAELMNHSDLSQYRRYAGVTEKRKVEAVAEARML